MRVKRMWFSQRVIIVALEDIDNENYRKTSFWVGKFTNL